MTNLAERFGLVGVGFRSRSNPTLAELEVEAIGELVTKRYWREGGILWGYRELVGSDPNGIYMAHYQHLPSIGWRKGKGGTKYFGPYQTWNVQLCDTCGEPRYKRRRLIVTYGKQTKTGEWFIWSVPFKGDKAEYSIPRVIPHLTCHCSLTIGTDGGVLLRKAGLTAGVTYSGLNARDFLARENETYRKEYPHHNKVTAEELAKRVAMKAARRASKRATNRIGGPSGYWTYSERKLVDKSGFGDSEFGDLFGDDMIGREDYFV